MKSTIALLAICLLAGCSNFAGKSAEYKAVHEKVFWESLNGGGMDGGAQAWANYRAHEAAEKQVGK